MAQQEGTQYFDTSDWEDDIERALDDMSVHSHSPSVELQNDTEDDHKMMQDFSTDTNRGIYQVNHQQIALQNKSNKSSIWAFGSPPGKTPKRMKRPSFGVSKLLAKQENKHNDNTEKYSQQSQQNSR